MAAAVTLTQRGHAVTVYEAARHWGGRARALTIKDLQGRPLQVDNGQHILIGAYSSCLQLMQTVGVNPDSALLRLPLDLRNAQGMGLQLPNLPPPWDAVLGIANAKGWRFQEKAALLARAAAWKRQHFQCRAGTTVGDLCHGLPQRLMADFIDPLCISALNLPADQACGQIFLRVLHDSLFAGKGGSNLLIPTIDLGSAFPAAAAAWLEQQGAHMHLGARVQSLTASAHGAPAGWLVDGEHFDHVVLATSSAEAARLAASAAQQLQNEASNQSEQWASTAQALPHTAIATVYAQLPDADNCTGAVLPAPMVALQTGPRAPVQFAFDRGQLHGTPGLLALVISASDALPADEHAQLQQLAVAQAAEQLHLPGLQPLKTVEDKRATFACTPQVPRPTSTIAPRLWACGDYVQGPYPATLEGAVRSGLEVANCIAPSS